MNSPSSLSHFSQALFSSPFVKYVVHLCTCSSNLSSSCSEEPKSEHDAPSPKAPKKQLPPPGSLLCCAAVSFQQTNQAAAPRSSQEGGRVEKQHLLFLEPWKVPGPRVPATQSTGGMLRGLGVQEFCLALCILQGPFRGENIPMVVRHKVKVGSSMSR